MGGDGRAGGIRHLVLPARRGSPPHAPETAQNAADREPGDCRGNGWTNHRRTAPGREDVGDPQARGNGLLRLEGQPRAQGVAQLDLALHLFGKGRLVRQIDLDRLEPGGREPAVDEGLQVVLSDGSLARHFTLLKTALRPLSMKSLKRARARLRRDITVPMGTSSTFAACS